MIEDLLSTFIFEKLDKQVIKKIPYCLLFALVSYYFVDSNEVVAALALVSFLLFLCTTYFFNRRISRVARDLWGNLDFKKLMGDISSIFEGESSLLKDMKVSKKWSLAFTGVFGGLSFSALLVLSFLLLLSSANLPKMFVLPFSVAIAIFLIQDIAKSGTLAEKDEEDKAPLLYGVINKYVVENSMRSSSLKRTSWRVILRIVSVFVGPLVNFELPKLSFENIVVYKDQDHNIEHLIKDLCQNEGSLKLKYEEGQTIDNFFTKGECDSIKNLAGRTPIQNFPYLFDPKYSRSDTERRKWIELSIIGKDSKGDESVGQMYIHLFKGASLKRKSNTNLYQIDPSGKEILFFFLIGEKSYVQYIKTRIETVSVKYPLDAFLKLGQID